MARWQTCESVQINLLGLNLSAFLVVPMITRHQALALGPAEQVIPPVAATPGSYN